MTELSAPWCDVLIVGGGPAGLFLGALLAGHGTDVMILERRSAPSGDSRAIGLHPPALQALAALGLKERFIDAGHRIRCGRATVRGRELGILRFARARSRDAFVLALPQSRTERLLENHLAGSSPAALRRGWEVTGLRESASGVSVSARSIARGPCGQPGQAGQGGGHFAAADSSCASAVQFHARLVVAADGAGSRVRDLLHLSRAGRAYPDTYLMGDVADPAPVERERGATVHLEPEGVVESFPLPEGQRRWVVHTGLGARVEPSPALLAWMVRARTGTVLDPRAFSMISAFAVRRRSARRLLSRRCVVIGDAAHEISPIGGQGITLAWLDALDLAPLLVRSRGHGKAGDLRSLRGWLGVEKRVQRRARVAGTLAAVNTVLGRPAPAAVSVMRSVLVACALRTPLRRVMAWAYSMGWTRLE